MSFSGVVDDEEEKSCDVCLYVEHLMGSNDDGGLIEDDATEFRQLKQHQCRLLIDGATLRICLAL